MRARGQVITQNQPELGCERFIKMEKIHDEIDRVDLKAKFQVSYMKLKYENEYFLLGRSKHFYSYYYQYHS